MKMLALSNKIVNEAFVGKVANRNDKVEIIFCCTDKYTMFGSYKNWFFLALI